MTRKARKKAGTIKATKRVAKEPKRAPAKKTKEKKPHEAIAAIAGKAKEKSIPEVAATHLEHMTYGLGYHIPSAWWRHAR